MPLRPTLLLVGVWNEQLVLLPVPLWDNPLWHNRLDQEISKDYFSADRCSRFGGARLFVVQRYDRIHLRGTTRWNVARCKSDEYQ